jgi:uncharacterized protein
MLAAMNNATKTIAVLLQRGAEVNARDTRTQATALIWAIGLEKVEAAKLLITKGADTNLADKDGRTPLMLAVSRGNEALVKSLLEAKADLSVKDKEGMTARDWAVKNGKNAILPLLGEPQPHN